MSALFISDLHLKAERPDITRVFLHFLRTRARRAEALYILGDFFDAWIGDEGMDIFQHSIAHALRQIADNGVRVFLMHGNRDFLIGQAFCREAGCILLGDPSVVELYGKRVLLMHGDSLCTRDVAYMRLRRCLRHPLTLWSLYHLPLAIRHKLARKLRKESQAQTRTKATEIIDVTPEEVLAAMTRHGVRTLIHGHTHRPAVYSLQLNGQQAQRVVLGDWDQQGWALEVDTDGYRQAPFPL